MFLRLHLSTKWFAERKKLAPSRSRKVYYVCIQYSKFFLGGGHSHSILSHKLSSFQNFTVQNSYHSQVLLLNFVQPELFECTPFVYNKSPDKIKFDYRAIKCLYRLCSHTKRAQVFILQCLKKS